MITSEYIIRYTDALYSDKENAPLYDEFRDMFSSGQIKSKEWLVNELWKTGYWSSNGLGYRDITIAGSWYGSLGFMLFDMVPSTRVKLLDIDPRCEKFLHHMIWDNPHIIAITEDMYLHTYDTSIVINTSCEHILDLRAWLDILPVGTIVALQSNNAFDIPGHINCVNSIDEFKQKASLKIIAYSGELVTPMYTRYMLIGKT